MFPWNGLINHHQCSWQPSEFNNIISCFTLKQSLSNSYVILHFFYKGIKKISCPKCDFSRSVYFPLFQHATKFGSVSQSCLSLCNLMDFSMSGCLVPSPSPKTGSNSHPSSQWCHPTISSSVVHFSSCLQSFSPSGSFNESVLHIRWPK